MTEEWKKHRGRGEGSAGEKSVKLISAASVENARTTNTHSDQEVVS